MVCLVLRCVFPVALVNSKDLFIDREKDPKAECILAEYLIST